MAEDYEDMLSPPEVFQGRSAALERFELAVIGVIALLTVALAGVVADLRDQVRESQVAVLRSRAVDCRIQLHLAITLKENCMEAEVTKYYDPEEVVARTQGALDNLSVNCMILRAHDLDHPVCPPP